MYTHMYIYMPPISRNDISVFFWGGRGERERERHSPTDSLHELSNVAQLQWAAVGCSEMQWVAVSCSELQRVAASCSELQRVTASCSELKTHTYTHVRPIFQWYIVSSIIHTQCDSSFITLSCDEVKTHTFTHICSTSQRYTVSFIIAHIHTHTYGPHLRSLQCHSSFVTLNSLQLTATHCNSLQLTATHCNSLQPTAAHCNSLQLERNTLTYMPHISEIYSVIHHKLHSTPCNSQQLTSSHCNPLQFESNTHTYTYM